MGIDAMKSFNSRFFSLSLPVFFFFLKKKLMKDLRRYFSVSRLARVN